jgi:hypothetical protein
MHAFLGRRLGRFQTLACALLIVVATLGLTSGRAMALPAFAMQTGEPCQACHVGGLGPQLTPFGRNFKLHGYTLRTNPFNIPLATMLQVSYLNTQKDQTPSAPNTSPNNNVTVDQFSLFFAGGWGDHIGAFIQGTYDGVAEQLHWDQTDIRAVDDFKIGKADVTVGASLNNSPGVQDAWNTLPSWGFPYTLSELAPAPATVPVLNGAFAQTTVGLTGYAWINDEFYLEGGGYVSPSANVLNSLGVDPAALGAIRGTAPYGRLAWQREVGPGDLELGTFALQAEIFPGLDHTTGLTDRYTDVGVDGSYIAMLKNGDAAGFNTRYLTESQRLNASCILDGSTPAACADNSLDDFRVDAFYYLRHRYGLTVQYFNTTGSPNSVIYANNRNLKPDSSGYVIQLDTTLFPNADAPVDHRFNARIGLQYTGYTQFDGAGRNFDGLGSNAADNNSIRVFIWAAD